MNYRRQLQQHVACLRSRHSARSCPARPPVRFPLPLARVPLPLARVPFLRSCVPFLHPSRSSVSPSFLISCFLACSIGLSAVTTGILTLANAKAVMGAEHMAEASKLVKGQAPLRFHVPERTKRSLCFEGDVRRLPRRADVCTALPPPLLALHGQLPLELAADELDVLPLLGIDPAELRRVRAAGGAKEAAVNAALRGLQESLRASIGDAYRRSCLAPRTAVPALTRLSGSEGKLLLLLPVTLSSLSLAGARVVVGLAVSERSGAAASGAAIGGAGGGGAAGEEFSDAATFPGTAPGPGGAALAEASSAAARAMSHLVYTVGALLSMPQARASARLLQPIAGTWLQPVAGSPDAAHWPPPSSAPLPSATTVTAPGAPLPAHPYDGDAAAVSAPVARSASAPAAATPATAGKARPAAAAGADGLPSDQLAFAAAITAATTGAAGGAGAASRPTAAAVAGRSASATAAPAAAAPAASAAASSVAAAAAAAAAAAVPADEADSMFRKAVVATVVRKPAPAAGAGKAGSAAAAAAGAAAGAAAPAAATIKLEVRDAEAVEMLLIMTPPELQTHPHFVALRNNGVLQLGWDKATFFNPTGEVVSHAADKTALLEAAATQGHDVIATLVSAENPFRLLVKAVRFH